MFFVIAAAFQHNLLSPCDCLSLHSPPHPHLFSLSLLQLPPHLQLETSKRVDDSLQRAKAAAVKSDFRTSVYYLDRCLEAAPRCLIFLTLRAEALALCQRYEDAHAMCK